MRRSFKVLLGMFLLFYIVSFVSCRDHSQKPGRTRQAQRKEVETQFSPVINPEGYATIGIFLIRHSEFGTSRIRHIELIGTISSGVTAYDVTLINGRKLQFWFKNGSIILVGEEINGGFIAHYGRM